MKRFWRYFVPVIASALLILFVAGILTTCEGQTVETDTELDVELWATNDRCYQHRAGGRAEVEGRWGIGFASAHLGAVWWGACDAKIPASPFNAEATKVLERAHGATVGLRSHGAFVGARIHRRAIQHIWLNRDRKNGWSGRAEPVQAACRADVAACPSIGYYDAIAPIMGYEGHGVDGHVLYNAYRWKALTLPWPDWEWDVHLTWKDWRIGTSGQAGGLADVAVSGRLERKIADRIWVGARLGSVPTPGWRDSLHRVAVSLSVQ